MSMKKKIATGALLVAFGATAVTGATLAYFTDAEVANNEFTVGNVDIELTEPNWDKTGVEDAKTVYPGEPLAKDPTIKNIGANPCFVRVSVSNLDQFGVGNEITYKTDYVQDKLGDNWVLHTDGYFYYKTPLEVNATTDALFDQIVMPTTLLGNEVAKDIVVTAEAVQAQGARPGWDKPEGDPMYPGVLQMNVGQIAAWFNTCYEGNIAPAK